MLSINDWPPFHGHSAIIAIPSIGALISLVKSGALDSLLIKNRSTEIVITDVVQFAVAQNHVEFDDAQAANEFLAKHPGEISVQPTDYGKMLIAALKNDDFEFPIDADDLSIISYLKIVTDSRPAKPVMVLIDDDWFKMHEGLALEGLHTVPVSCFLTFFENR